MEKFAKDNPFTLSAPFQPQGDQPKAIAGITKGFLRDKRKELTLLGVTGSGKTFTMAHVIQKMQKPTLVLSHNKTLAAQLYNEFKEFFPNSAVCYFVSYYDYYQPESYLPSSDTYIEKDSMINEQIERMRMEAASALLTRNDVIIISSVSCIYGFGEPQNFEEGSTRLSVRSGNRDISGPRDLAKKLVEMQYERNDTELKPGRFRVRGDTVDIVQGYSQNVVRVEFFGDDIERIQEIHPVSGRNVYEHSEVTVFPAKAFIVPQDRQKRAIEAIRKELEDYLPKLDAVEAYRLKQRTEYDIEMIEQLGYCKGIENYSRHFDLRRPGSHPFTLLDFFRYKFGNEWMMFIDESHVTLPQVRGMYGGDRARKENLIQYGFRLPSAFDNRPLRFHEFESYLPRTLYVSATPGEYEKDRSDEIIEQIIRPTGLVDPKIYIRPTKNQVQDTISEVLKTAEQGYRTLVTTLTKRLAEELTSHLREEGVKAEYLHSDIGTMERTEIIKNLRLGKFDVLVGINLLREGLDIPEVALVAILDADREGFLRNETSLIQTTGRAARNIHSRVIMYADKKTRSIAAAVRETERRRERQIAYNTTHHITPKSIEKAIAEERIVVSPHLPKSALDIEKKIVQVESEMQRAAEMLNFEEAIELRDRMAHLKKELHKKSPPNT